MHIGLPNQFIAPSMSDGIFDQDQFYWDSYFIILGLISSGKVKLAKGMVDNLVYLYQRFGVIPGRNQYHDLARSQPPFLTQMVAEVFSKTQDRLWLKRCLKTAEAELNNYWMNQFHLQYKGLSRYCDSLITNASSEDESGWDFTSRFHEQCLDFLPLDLNSLLFKYELDLAGFYSMLKNSVKQELYATRAKQRKKNMNHLLWNKKSGFFFDYNYRTRSQSKFFSLAGYYPLWAGWATEEQAAMAVSKLRIFEYTGGLANTQKHLLFKSFKQWDYPNGWPNQQWVVIKGLLNYGYRADAERLAIKWLNTNKRIYKKTGMFWEKYNVVKTGIGQADRYPTQTGFGWTNGVFLRLVAEFSS